MNREDLRSALKRLDNAIRKYVPDMAAREEIRDAVSDVSEYLLRSHDAHVRMNANVNKLLLKCGVNH